MGTINKTERHFSGVKNVIISKITSTTRKKLELSDRFQGKSYNSTRIQGCLNTLYMTASGYLKQKSS